MIDKVVVENFRSFPKLTVDGLERINLFIGSNNSGKSSLLEALRIVLSRDVHVVRDCLKARGEIAFVPQLSSRERVYDMRGLFYGYSFADESRFSIVAHSLSETIECVARVIQFKMPPSSTVSESDIEDEADDQPALLMSWGDTFQKMWLRPQGGRIFKEVKRPMPPNGPSVQFVSTAGFLPKQLGRLWSDFALTSEEDQLIQALQTLDPAIERIAWLGDSTSKSDDADGFAGFAVKLKGIDGRVALGTLGDGTWRLLGLAAALARAQNGYLLVDEIDTGLHHLAMADMWRMVAKTARRLNVQVFATTHSMDCVRELAAIFDDKTSVDFSMSLQRVERNNAEAVRYSSEEVMAAAARMIEVR